MAVYNLQKSLYHFHRNHAACHLSDCTEWHVVLEQGVEIRNSRCLALFQLFAQLFTDEAGNSALRVIHLAKGIVHAKLAAPASVRNGMSQDRLVLLISDLLDFSLHVRRNAVGIVWHYLSGSDNGKRILKTDIRTACTDHNAVNAAFYFPFICLHIPVTECLVVELNGNGFLLACL